MPSSIDTVWGELVPGVSQLPAAVLAAATVLVGRHQPRTTQHGRASAATKPAVSDAFNGPASSANSRLVQEDDKCQHGSAMALPAACAGTHHLLAQHASRSQVVSVNDSRVSRLHCIVALQCFGGCMSATVEDCSTNGTLLNGQPLPRGVPVPLRAGDRISLVLSANPLADLYYTYLEAPSLASAAVAGLAGPATRAAYYASPTVHIPRRARTRTRMQPASPRHTLPCDDHAVIRLAAGSIDYPGPQSPATAAGSSSNSAGGSSYQGPGLSSGRRAYALASICSVPEDSYSDGGSDAGGGGSGWGSPLGLPRSPTAGAGHRRSIRRLAFPTQPSPRSAALEGAGAASSPPGEEAACTRHNSEDGCSSGSGSGSCPTSASSTAGSAHARVWPMPCDGAGGLAGPGGSAGGRCDAAAAAAGGRDALRVACNAACVGVSPWHCSGGGEGTGGSGALMPLHVRAASGDEVPMPETARYPALFGSEGGSGVALDCPLCGDEMLTCVAVQPCGHSFCAACLSQALERQVLRGARLACPTCRGASLELVEANIHVRRLAEMHRQQDEADWAASGPPPAAQRRSDASGAANAGQGWPGPGSIPLPPMPQPHASSSSAAPSSFNIAADARAPRPRPPMQAGPSRTPALHEWAPGRTPQRASDPGPTSNSLVPAFVPPQASCGQPAAAAAAAAAARLGPGDGTPPLGQATAPHGSAAGTAAGGGGSRRASSPRWVTQLSPRPATPRPSTLAGDGGSCAPRAGSAAALPPHPRHAGASGGSSGSRHGRAGDGRASPSSTAARSSSGCRAGMGSGAAAPPQCSVPAATPCAQAGASIDASTGAEADPQGAERLVVVDKGVGERCSDENGSKDGEEGEGEEGEGEEDEGEEEQHEAAAPASRADSLASAPAMSTICPLDDGVLPLPLELLLVRQAEVLLARLREGLEDATAAADAKRSSALRRAAVACLEDLSSLAWLAWDCQQVRRAVTVEGGLAVVVDALQLWCRDPLLGPMACRALAALVRGAGVGAGCTCAQANQWALAKGGGVELLVGVLRSQRSLPGVAAAMMELLAAMAEDNLMMQAHLCKEAAGEVALALQAHREDAAVQAAGLRLLAGLMHGHDPMHVAVRQQLGEAGVAAEAAAALRAHGGHDPDVLQASRQLADELLAVVPAELQRKHIQQLKRQGVLALLEKCMAATSGAGAVSTSCSSDPRVTSTRTPLLEIDAPALAVREKLAQGGSRRVRRCSNHGESSNKAPAAATMALHGAQALVRGRAWVQMAWAVLVVVVALAAAWVHGMHG